MATFPTKEAEVLSLAMEIMYGLTAHPDIYPSPPVLPGSLSGRINTAIAKSDIAKEKQAAAEEATKEKQAAFAELEQGMKDILRYAEVTVHMDDEKLKLLGWSAHRAKQTLEPPTQAQALRAAEQGLDWIRLAWLKPAGGGPVQLYRVQRLKPDEDQWFDVGSSIETECKIEHQERGLEFTYWVIATNKAGDALPSNIVKAVL